MFKKIGIYGESWTGTLPQLLHSNLQDKGVEVSLFDYSDIMPGIKNRTLVSKIMRRLFYKIYVVLININFLKYVYDNNSFPISSWISSHSIALPIGPHMDLDDVDYVIQTIKDTLVKTR